MQIQNLHITRIDYFSFREHHDQSVKANNLFESYFFDCGFGSAWVSLMAQMLKNLPAVQETRVWSMSQEIHCRMEWLPNPVFLPRKSQWQRSQAGYSPWGHKESETTEWWTLSLLALLPIIKSTSWKYFFQEVFNKKCFHLSSAFMEFCHSHYASGSQFDGHSSHCNFWPTEKNHCITLNIYLSEPCGRESQTREPASEYVYSNYTFQYWINKHRIGLGTYRRHCIKT